MAQDQKQPEEEKKIEDTRPADKSKVRNRTISEVGTNDKGEKVYKHEGIGAVAPEDMRRQAVVGEANEKSRKEAREQGLDTTPEAAAKSIEEGSRNKKDTGNVVPDEVGNEIAETLENEQPLRRIVDQTNQAEIAGQTASDPTVQYAFTTRLVKRVPDADIKGVVIGGLEDIYDEFDKQLSTSEREAFGYNPDAGVIAFQKFLGRQDQNILRAKLTEARSEKK